MIESFLPYVSMRDTAHHPPNHYPSLADGPNSCKIAAPLTLEQEEVAYAIKDVEKARFVLASDDTVLFVARASTSNLGSGGSDELRDWLRESLEYTREDFESEYGTIPCEIEYLTIIQGSNRKFCSVVTDAFTRLFRKYHSSSGRVVVIMNGFDGFTTHEVALWQLLNGNTHNCESFVFAADPRTKNLRRRFFSGRYRSNMYDYTRRNRSCGWRI